MASFDRGTKRQCLHCGTKFYDLNRDPILCPSCGKQFLLDEPRKPVAEEVKDEIENEEAEVDTAAEAAGAEVISLDDAEDDDEDDDDIPDVEDVEVDEDLGDDDEDVFLEEDDEDDDKLGIDVATDDED